MERVCDPLRSARGYGHRRRRPISHGDYLLAFGWSSCAIVHSTIDGIDDVVTERLSQCIRESVGAADAMVVLRTGAPVEMQLGDSFAVAVSDHGIAVSRSEHGWICVRY